MRNLALSMSPMHGGAAKASPGTELLALGTHQPSWNSLVTPCMHTWINILNIHAKMCIRHTSRSSNLLKVKHE